MRPFTEDDLRRRAAGGAFARGQEYLERVGEVREARWGATATVSGTHNYHVSLTHDGTALSGTCTCPIGSRGEFCKHCVAVGMTLLADQPAATLRSLDDEDARLRAYLDTLDRGILTQLLWGHALADPNLYRKLSQHAAAPKRPGRGHRGQR